MTSKFENETVDHCVLNALSTIRGGMGVCEGELGYLRLHFEHFEIQDISQTFNLQM